MELKSIVRLFNAALGSQSQLLKSLKSIEAEVAKLESAIEAKKHYFVGCQKVEAEGGFEQQKEGRVEGEDRKFDSEASLVKMLRRKMARLKEVFGAKNKRLDECQTTVEYTQLRELEVTVEEQTSALEGLLEWTRSEAEVARLGCRLGRSEAAEAVGESSVSGQSPIAARLGAEEEEASETPGDSLSANQRQFLRNHLQIEAVRKRNAYLITCLQTVTAENQHFGELRRSVRTELAAQNRTIGLLQNELRDRKETFSFSQAKMASSSYLGFQKAYSSQFRSANERKVGRKDGVGRAAAAAESGSGGEGGGAEAPQAVL